MCDDYDFRGHPSVGFPLTPDATMDSGYAYPCWDKDLGDVPDDLRDACYQMFQGRCTNGTRFARVSHHHISHLANADRDPGCHGDEGEFAIELVASTLDYVGFEVQKDPSWYSQFPMRRLNMAPGDGRQVHFAYGIPDGTPDGTYDSCISITNTFTGLRKGFLHRLTLGQPFDEFRHNRLGNYGPVDYDGDGTVSAGEQGLFLAISTACDGLAGCDWDANPDCEWDWHPDFCHVEDEVACDGAYAALGTEDRCWEASWSPDDAAHYAYRGRDQCENLGAFCKGGAKILEAEACDDPLLMPCKNQANCFQDTTAWTELGRSYDYAGRVVSALDYDADASLEPWATPGPCQTAWTLDPLRDALPTAPVGSNFLCGEDGAGGANSLHGTAFCEHTASKADVAALGWTWPEETAAFPHARWAGFIQEGHACWVSDGDEAEEDEIDEGEDGPDLEEGQCRTNADCIDGTTCFDEMMWHFIPGDDSCSEEEGCCCIYEADGARYCDEDGEDEEAAECPDWTFNEAQYEKTMTATVLPKIDGTNQVEGELSAWIDGESHALSGGTDVLPSGPYAGQSVHQVMIHGGAAQEDGEIVWKLCVDGAIYVSVGSAEKFQADGQLGDAVNPIIVDFVKESSRRKLAKSVKETSRRKLATSQGEPDVECAKRLCEETDECGGLTVGWVEKDAPMGADPEARRGRPFFVYFLQRGLIGRPDLDSFNNWNKRGEGSGSTEIACLYKPQASPTADECTCFGVYLDGTSPIVPPGACPKPTPAPSPAPTGDTTTTTTTTAALSAAPTPAPTGEAVAACEDDADWLAKSNKKKARKCGRKTKKKCKKKCSWVEDTCVEKLQSCEALFYKKGKPKKEGAKLVKACKKKGTIGDAKKKASAACQKACGTCDEAGAVVDATTTTAGLTTDCGEGESCGYGEACGYNCAAGLWCEWGGESSTCVRIATDRGEGEACGEYGLTGVHLGECAAGLSCESPPMTDPPMADVPMECVRGPSCESKRGRDSKSWHRKGAPTKTCKWVERKPTTRCRKRGATGARAVAECVRACASCPSEGACSDDATWFRHNKKNKKLDCVSVARNPGRRCGMPGAKAACPATCGTC